MNKFQAAANRVIHHLGATPHPSYGMRLDTVAGPMDITAYDTWVATRFADVPRAKCVIGFAGGRELNPYSGKWNWHFSDAELKSPATCAKSLFEGLACVLPGHDRYGPMQAASGQLYDPTKPCGVALTYLYRLADGSQAEDRVVFQPGWPSRMHDVRPLTYATRLQKEGGCFVPGQVGLRDLQGSIPSWDPKNDTPFHELVKVEWTQSEAPTDPRTFEEFVDACIDVALSPKGWDVRYRPAFSNEARGRVQLKAHTSKAALKLDPETDRAFAVRDDLNSIDRKTEQLISILEHTGALDSAHTHKAALELRLAVAQSIGDEARSAIAREALAELEPSSDANEEPKFATPRGG